MSNFYGLYKGEFVFNPNILIPTARLDLLTLLSFCLDQDNDCIPILIDVFHTKQEALANLKKQQSFLNIRPGYCNGIEYHFNIFWVNTFSCSLINSKKNPEFIKIASLPFSNCAEYLLLDYKIDINLVNHQMHQKTFYDVLNDVQEIIPAICYYCDFYDLNTEIKIESEQYNQSIILNYRNSFVPTNKQFPFNEVSDFSVSIRLKKTVIHSANIERLNDFCEMLMSYMNGNGYGYVRVFYMNHIISNYLLKIDESIHDRIIPNLEKIYIDLNKDHNLYIQP